MFLTLYIGVGGGYSDDSAAISLAEDGLHGTYRQALKFYLPEWKFPRSWCQIFGLWSDFAETDFDLGIGLIWWVNDGHGFTWLFAFF